PTPRAGTGVSRKKRLYVKLLPRDVAGTAVFDVKLSSKSKALPHYMKIGEIGHFAIWCKKGPVLPSEPLPPVPKPRTISAGLQQLSLQPPDPPQQYVGAAPGLFLRRLPLLSPAMDGVPFTLHPRFESKLSWGSNAILADLNVKSLADIEEEYNYAFVVERTAAARLPPGVC
ncbi:Multivesicular body subunit 12A, partial [Leptosomus discolor]